jgi:hypothetical protein
LAENLFHALVSGKEDVLESNVENAKPKLNTSYQNAGRNNNMYLKMARHLIAGEQG